MKKLRKNSGFTLIECVVAMAVLAVMTLGLLMILNATVKQRNLNTQMEREVDNQVEKVVQRKSGDTETEDLGSDGKIVFNDGTKDVFTLSGGQKVYYDNKDDDSGLLEIGALKFIDAGEASDGDNDDDDDDDDDDDPIDITKSSKVYGAADVDKITVVYDSIDGPKEGTDADGNKYEYYNVVWKITFSADTVASYLVSGTMGVESVKVLFPEGAEIVKFKTNNLYACPYIHVLGLNRDTIRMEPQAKNSSISVYVTFEINVKDYGYYTPATDDKPSEFISYTTNPSKLITDHFEGTSEPAVDRS